MKENTCASITEAAAIIRAVLIRILTGKTEESAKERLAGYKKLAGKE